MVQLHIVIIEYGISGGYLMITVPRGQHGLSHAIPLYKDNNVDKGMINDKGYMFQLS